MINTKHLLKVTLAWTSIVYAVCFAAVAAFPGVRQMFMTYGLHMNINIGENAVNSATFLIGLVLWNVIDLLAVWLFAALFNGIKE